MHQSAFLQALLQQQYCPSCSISAYLPCLFDFVLPLPMQGTAFACRLAAACSMPPSAATMLLFKSRLASSSSRPPVWAGINCVDLDRSRVVLPPPHLFRTLSVTDLVGESGLCCSHRLPEDSTAATSCHLCLPQAPEASRIRRRARGPRAPRVLGQPQPHGAAGCARNFAERPRGRRRGAVRARGLPPRPRACHGAANTLPRQQCPHHYPPQRPCRCVGPCSSSPPSAIAAYTFVDL